MPRDHRGFTMLFKLKSNNAKIDELEPVAYKDFASFGKREKELEELIAASLFGVLFEDARLMPVFQERQYQAEADIYALNECGDLTIFELKRGSAGNDAVHQALRYVQDAAGWSFADLRRKYQQYKGSGADLQAAHKEAFDLEHVLEPKEFNRRQRVSIIGSAADESLISAVDYWKRQGIAIDFLPYRIYEIANERYFEFFAPPYDVHKNPHDLKGVLFDTNRSYDEDAIWDMLEMNRVAAYGDAKRFVHYLSPGDIVFLSHKWTGVVAAGKVRNTSVKLLDDKDGLYRDVEFLTPVPQRSGSPRGMPFRKVSEYTGKSFYWARTIKVPYLSRSEADALVSALNDFLVPPTHASLAAPV